MARPKLDITGTAKEAAARGVSRRTIQRERARLRQHDVALTAAQPVQLSLDGFEPTKLPDLDAVRFDPLEAAADLGWMERAARHRLREALERGDPAQVKMFSSALLDVHKVLDRVEPLAERRVSQLPRRLRERAEVSADFEKYLATHGPAYIRAMQPSPTECHEDCVEPMLPAEIERWNEYHEERPSGPCERELLAARGL